MDDEQRKQVKELIEAHDVTRRLSSGQKWGVAVIMASFLGGAVAVLGFGGYFVVENAAKVRAGQVAATDAANELLSGGELIRRITEATTVIPAGAVLAFDRSEGCPTGWIEYASARGRAIIGATPLDARPDDKTGGLTPREFQQQGGAETHTLTVREMPKHDHTGKTSTNDEDVWHAADGHVPVRQSSDGDLGFSTRQPKHEHGIPAEGGGQPHNNMSPYIALYFCKKEG